MKKQKQQPPTLIKGYLPLRLSLPAPFPNAPPLTTFLYLKEHVSKQKTSSHHATLFVANAPANGPIRTDLFLRAMFERYAEVVRVTVAHDPRKTLSDDHGDENEAVELFKDPLSASVKKERGDGKFAHVIFSSGKEMKRAMRGLSDDAMQSHDGILKLDDETLDRLVQETARLRRNDDSLVQDDDDAMANNLSGIHAIVHQHHIKSYRHIPRSQLMEQCNSAMSAYEQTEAAASARAKALASQPDDDGFITVTHSSTNAFSNELETTQHEVGRSKGSKRNRKRKADNRHGGSEFHDFYKFQWKETKKREMNDLKKRFEEDLEKVKRMKEERGFRPF
jgi:ribosomal RNA-processing protein 7